jgi:hypothetical protein
MGRNGMHCCAEQQRARGISRITSVSLAELNATLFHW